MNLRMIFLSPLLIFAFFACKETNHQKPVNIYISWAAHDELSDSVKLTEGLANKELDAFLFLRSKGVKLDYFLMDMFWFSKHTLFKSFNEQWKSGHQAFFKKAKDNDVKLGLWLSANVLGWNENMRWLDYQDTLVSSISQDKRSMVLNEGIWPGYFNSVLEYWYGEGVTLFKIDFAAFYTSRENITDVNQKNQMIEQNEKAFYDLVESFRKKHPDCKFIAYNGFVDEGKLKSGAAIKWLNIFDSLFCGDPQPGLVPFYDFWQSIEIYSDQMFWTFAKNNIPVSRIDNSQFMLSNTGTGHNRGKKEWKTMLISALSKHSMVQTFYGNIDLLNANDAEWITKAQKLFYQMDTLQLIGEYPYEAKPVLYHLKNGKGGLVYILNPSQQVKNVKLPEEYKDKTARVIFSQNGHQNTIIGNSVSVAPEQSVLVGFMEYAGKEYSLGMDEDVQVPDTISPIEILDKKELAGSVSFIVPKPEKGNIRLVFQFFDSQNNPEKINGGAPPNGKFMDKVLHISAKSGNLELPVSLSYNLQIWAGLAWATGEIDEKYLRNLTGNIEVTFKINDNNFKGKIIENCYNTIYRNY